MVNMPLSRVGAGLGTGVGADVVGTVGAAEGGGVEGLKEVGGGDGGSVSSPRLPHHSAVTVGLKPIQIRTRILI